MNVAKLALVKPKTAPVLGKNIRVNYAPLTIAQQKQINAAATRLSAEFHSAVVDYFERRGRYEAYAEARPEWRVWDGALTRILDAATLKSVLADLESRELVEAREQLRHIANRLLNLADETGA